MTTDVPGATPAAQVLIVEDSRTQAERLRHILEAEGLQASVAANGRLALERVAHALPDLVISDVNMPEMDGYELARRLKASAAWRHVPVILVTSMSDPEDVIRGLQSGADGFVLKPYDEAYLLARVRSALANRHLARAEDGEVAVFFNGERHSIHADRARILNLLLSTYEAAIQRNRELTRSQQALEKRSEDMLLANRFLDEVIENIPHMIFVKDAADLRYVRVNRAIEELLGRPREQILGRRDDDLFEPELAQLLAAQDRTALAGGGAEGYEARIETASGPRTVRARKAVVLDEFERPRFVLGIGEDITRKKDREEEILRLNAALEQRTAEADAANKAKSTFLATMSHEIRTPLNGLLGMLELLTLTRLDEDQRNTLGVIRESSATLLRIVDDVLDFSKIEAGQLEVRAEPVSVPRILKDVQRGFAAAAASKGLTLKTLADPDLSPALWVDPVRLRQIVGNFVSNAIKFTERGSVEIRAERVGVTGTRELVRLQVRDTGIGITPEDQRRLFQPFSQGSGDAARRAGGTGLGLTICRRLAELMGGSVSLASEAGRGTTLTLELSLEVADETSRGPDTLPPAEDGAAALQREPPTVAEAEREGRLVLVVDDHPTNRMLLLRQVNTLGYAAETAVDGLQALAQWRSGRFALVITDCEMPGLSGYEFARSVRSEEARAGARRTPILACTAHALAGEVENCLAAGMDDCLVKPIDLRRLHAALRRWLPGRTGPTPAPPAPAPVAAEPVDRQVIAATWGGEPGKLREILGHFRRNNDEDLSDLRAALAQPDLLAARRAAHRMLGASRMVGAAALAAACDQAQRALAAGDAAGAAQAMEVIEREQARLNTWIEGLASPAERPS